MSTDLDQSTAFNHNIINEGQNHHLSKFSADGMGLLQAKHAISSDCNSFYFGPERKTARIEARDREIRFLPKTLIADVPTPPPNFTGGEHAVWVLGEPASRVFKKTLEGAYGYVLDEEVLLDARTFLMRRRLIMRPALPSEYLLRWLVLQMLFQLPTRYEGYIPNEKAEPCMAISQPYIEQDETDQPQPEDIINFMVHNGFQMVEGDKVITPEQKAVTWYRPKDGVLISDAYARNFRKYPGYSVIVPVDLVVTIVPPGISKLLPEPEEPWKFDFTPVEPAPPPDPFSDPL